jgi:hypothetical protein
MACMQTLPERVTAIEEKFAGLEKRMDLLEGRMSRLETRMDWLIGFQFATLLSVIGIYFAK